MGVGKVWLALVGFVALLGIFSKPMLLDIFSMNVFSIFESECGPMRFSENIGVINPTPYINNAQAFSIKTQKFCRWVDLYFLSKLTDLIWHDGNLRLLFSALKLRRSNRVQHIGYFDGYVFGHRLASVCNKHSGDQWIIPSYDNALNANICPQLVSGSSISAYDELSSGPPEEEGG